MTSIIVFLSEAEQFLSFPKPHDQMCFGRANATGILAGLSTLVWRFMGMSFRLNLLLRAVAEQSQIISLYSPT